MKLYFTVAGFGDLRNDNDPNCTYEGENNVLLQQASNWLLACRKNGYEHFNEISPLQSAQFLQSFDTIIKQKCNWTTTQGALNTQSKVLFILQIGDEKNIKKISVIKPEVIIYYYRYFECIGLACCMVIRKNISIFTEITK